MADKNNKAEWDDYVQRHPLSSPYHLYAWKRVVEDAYRHSAYYLMAEENNCIRGVLPLIYLKLPFVPGRLVSLPFCDVGDVLADNADTGEMLVSETVTLAKKLKVKCIELRGQALSLDTGHLNLPVYVLSHKVRMLLKLPKSSEILWNGFKSKLRSQVRKAEKNGLSFRWGTIKNVEDYYSVFSRNMRDLGSPVHSKRWFYAISQYYGDNMHMGMVYYDKQLIGAGIILSTNNSISIPWASTFREYNKLSPNMLLYWNFLKYASDNRYAEFDFGRSTPNEGIYHFKAQWGAEPIPLHWNYVMLNNKKMIFNGLTSAKRKKIASIWRSLPLSVANLIGPAIRRHISL